MITESRAAAAAGICPRHSAQHVRIDPSREACSIRVVPTGGSEDNDVDAVAHADRSRRGSDFRLFRRVRRRRAGGAAERRCAAAANSTALPWEEARLFAEVYERIKREYVDEVDDHALMEKAMRGMVAALDPHSAFLDSEEFEEIRLSTMGSYPGVGIEVVAEDSAVKILRPIDGSPADQAGLLPGDLIVRIDGNDIGADLAGAIAQHARRLGQHREAHRPSRPDGSRLLDFSLRRAKVDVHSVAQQSLEPGYGYLRITGFSETTADDVSRAVRAPETRQSTGHQGPGARPAKQSRRRARSGRRGRRRLPERGRHRDRRRPHAGCAVPHGRDAWRPHRRRAAGRARERRLGSASEIVAGALKDHGRAELIGHKTYGKGSVQTVMPLSHGGAVKLTTSRYFTPSGGVDPWQGHRSGHHSPKVRRMHPVDLNTAVAPCSDSGSARALQTLKAEGAVTRTASRFVR